MALYGEPAIIGPMGEVTFLGSPGLMKKDRADEPPAKVLAGKARRTGWLGLEGGISNWRGGVMRSAVSALALYDQSASTLALRESGGSSGGGWASAERVVSVEG